MNIYTVTGHFMQYNSEEVLCPKAKKKPNMISSKLKITFVPDAQELLKGTGNCKNSSYPFHTKSKSSLHFTKLK